MKSSSLRQAKFDVQHIAIAEMREQWLTDTAIKEVEKYSKKMANYLRELREKPDDYQPFVHPRNWAAFICIGNQAAIEN